MLVLGGRVNERPVYILKCLLEGESGIFANLGVPCERRRYLVHDEVATYG